MRILRDADKNRAMLPQASHKSYCEFVAISFIHLFIHLFAQ